MNYGGKRNWTWKLLCAKNFFALFCVFFFRHGMFDFHESVPYKILVEQFSKHKTTVTTNHKDKS